MAPTWWRAAAVVEAGRAAGETVGWNVSPASWPCPSTAPAGCSIRWPPATAPGRAIAGDAVPPGGRRAARPCRCIPAAFEAVDRERARQFALLEVAARTWWARGVQLWGRAIHTSQRPPVPRKRRRRRAAPPQFSRRRGAPAGDMGLVCLNGVVDRTGAAGSIPVVSGVSGLIRSAGSRRQWWSWPY